MKRIGIIGGLSPESTAYYYREFIRVSRELFELGAYPELIVYNLNFREFSKNPKGWDGRKEMLIDAGKRLRKAGAEILGISANTPHIVFPEVEKEVGGKWVSIIDAVGSEAKRMGAKKVLLLGTKTTMTMPFYREALERMGISVEVPGQERIEEIDRIIREELMFEDLRSKGYLVELIESYRVDAVILGCTELPLAIKEGDVSIPVLDSAKIHIREMVKKASEN